MAIHYGPDIGIPYCGSNVVDDSGNKNTRWKSGQVHRKKKRVTASTESTKIPGDVDCGGCITQMTTDGILP